MRNSPETMNTGDRSHAERGGDQIEVLVGSQEIFQVPRTLYQRIQQRLVPIARDAAAKKVASVHRSYPSAKCGFGLCQSSLRKINMPGDVML